MRITFLVPCKDLAGGLKVVTAYGNALLRRGHDVTVIYPERKFPWKEKYKRKVKRWLYQEKDHLDFFKGKLIQVPELNETTTPEADILVATAWETVIVSQNFPSSKGRKYYLIQHYETWSGEAEIVQQTYRQANFQKIVISQWLKDKITSLTGETNIPLIANGRDLFLSEYKGEGLARSYDLGMMYSTVAFKRSDIGLKAILTILKQFPKLKVIMFGSEYPQEQLPSNIQFHRRPPQAKLKEYYSTTKIWVSSSEVEGFCLPALEAISCGCAVVATDSGGVRDIIQHGFNGSLVAPNQIEELSQEIAKVLQDEKLQILYRNNGLTSAENFSWEHSTKSLEDLFQGVGS